MELYIQVQNGQTVNHPAFGNNLRQVFKEIPLNWEPFVRTEKPIAGVYEIFEFHDPFYQKVDGVWTDVWVLRPMTEVEKTAKQQSVKDAWAARKQADNWVTWIFNEITCTYDPPIPRPDLTKEKIVFWCGAENNWKDAPFCPKDGKQYEFDFFAWSWMPVEGAGRYAD